MRMWFWKVNKFQEKSFVLYFGMEPQSKDENSQIPWMNRWELGHATAGRDGVDDSVERSRPHSHGCSVVPDAGGDARAHWHFLPHRVAVRRQCHESDDWGNEPERGLVALPVLARTNVQSGVSADVTQLVLPNVSVQKNLTKWIFILSLE